MFPVLRCTSLAAILVVACGYGSTVTAQQSPASYPSKPVKIVIPLGPGNSLEIATRLVAEKLTGALGQPFVIEAQPGAAGQIGTERVARSPADGYTLLSANDGIITMLPNLQKHVRFDPVRDFSPIAQMIGIPIVLIAHPSVQAKTAQELVQLAEAGIPLRFATWGGLFAPAGTPVEIIRRLNRETLVALNSADVQAKMAEFGFEIYGNSPEQFSDVVKADLVRVASLIKRAGIEPQ